MLTDPFETLRGTTEMSRAGLKKIKKSTKRGARSYWVKANETPAKLRSAVLHDRADQGRTLGHGMAALGSGAGLLLGSRLGQQHGVKLAGVHNIPRAEAAFGAALVGGHVGSKVGRHTGRVTGHVLARAGNMSQSTESILGSFAHIAGTGMKLYGYYNHARQGIEMYGKHRDSFHRAYDAYNTYMRSQ